MDVIIHKAALASVPASVADPLYSNAVNITGTLNMLTAAREAGVKRFVFASSSSVYGDEPEPVKTERSGITAVVALRSRETRGRGILPDVFQSFRP